MRRGVSGATLTRPALERLRDRAAEGAFEVLLCHAPDRLARRYAYQVLLLEELARAGIEVVFARGGEHAGSPEDELLRQFQGMIAEYERAQIRERTRRGKLHRARTGHQAVMAGAPYGYRFVKKTDLSDGYWEERGGGGGGGVGGPGRGGGAARAGGGRRGSDGKGREGVGPRDGGGGGKPGAGRAPREEEGHRAGRGGDPHDPPPRGGRGRREGGMEGRGDQGGVIPVPPLIRGGVGRPGGPGKSGWEGQNQEADPPLGDPRCREGGDVYTHPHPGDQKGDYIRWMAPRNIATWGGRLAKPTHPRRGNRAARLGNVRQPPRNQSRGGRE